MRAGVCKMQNYTAQDPRRRFPTRKICIYLVVGIPEVAYSQLGVQIRNKFVSNRTQPILSFQFNMRIPDASSIFRSNDVLRFLFSDALTLFAPLE
jgi:hypothetical protein